MRKNGFIVVVSFFVFFSCGNSGKGRYHVSDLPGIDSARWYDSTFALSFFRLDTFFQNRYDYHEFNGNVLIALRGRVIYQKTFGCKTPGDSTPISPDDAFQLASITKTFTSTAILQLCRAGKLSLDDTLNKFIPRFPYRDITIRHLLSHRSGLPEYFHFTDRLIHGKKPAILYNDTVIDLMISRQPKKAYPPDFKYDYCNTGYVLLAHIIEKVSGKRFDKYIRDSIFIPAGMKRSFVWIPWENNLPGYALQGFEDMESISYSQLNEAMGDKGVYSTCGDMLCYDQALMLGKILDKKWQEMAYTGMHDELPESANYGLGWRIIRFQGRRIVYHSGWWKGFRTVFMRDTEMGLTAVVLTNIRRGPYVSVYNLLDLFYGDSSSVRT